MGTAKRKYTKEFKTEAVMGTAPSNFKGADNPVDSVSWDDAQEFIAKLNKMLGTNTYRLPTEAEWEYAATSGGKGETYAGTSDESSLDEYAWYAKNSGEKTRPVGGKKPNGLGLFDMSGNVWEWVADWYDENYYKQSPADNPKGPSIGECRVLRGGSWYNDPDGLHTTARYCAIPGIWSDNYGFRCAQR
jgi:formylglycine-generating enzyme required for sulfatase activity